MLKNTLRQEEYFVYILFCGDIEEEMFIADCEDFFF